MRKFIAAALFSASLFYHVPAYSQVITCNNPSGFLQTLGEIDAGDLLLLSNDCLHVIDGGANTLNPSGSPTITGNWIFAPSSGDAITINTAPGSFGKGLKITQSSPATGSVVGPLNYNEIDITHQVGTTGTETQSAGFRLNESVGGASLVGQPIIGAFFNMQETIPGVVSSSDKIGAVGSSLLNQSDPTSGFYGLNSIVTIESGGASDRAVGNESDVDIRAGGTSHYRYAFSAVTVGPNKGTTLDTAFFVGNIGSNTGAFQNLMTLSNSLGFAPIQTNGTLFSSDTAFTVANVFSMANATITGKILDFVNVSLTGGGEMALQDLTVKGGPATISTGQGSLGASANSGLILIGHGAINDLVWNNNLGSNVCAVATGTQILACNTITASVPLGTLSGGTGNGGGAWPSFTPGFSCGTGVFTTTSATSQTIGKLTSIQFDITLATLGTCTTPFTFTLPNVSAKGGSLDGLEATNSSSPITCQLAAGSATATCRKNANTNAQVSDHYLMTASYQNQ